VRDGPRAVVFDYVGTLTAHAPAAARRQGADRVAQVLGVDHDLFFEHVSATFTERATGSCGDEVATMAWLAMRCGREPTPEQLSGACAERRSGERTFANLLRDDAVPTLRRLKEAGFPVGVVSDCTHELPECWPELPVAPLVDTVVFSVEMGKRKPHPSLYRAACAGLGVAPAEVVYVGDGGSNELTGARAVGMSAVRLLTDDAADALVYDPEPDWKGPVISSLGGVVDLVIGRRARAAELGSREP
jgi:putative hydrolase of the HAD superfamily